MKRIMFVLTAVLLLSGCTVQKNTVETESAITEMALAAVEETTIPETTQPTEPELPWEPEVRWYRTYYFDKRPNPDPNIVEGVVRFNSLLRNENRDPLTIESAHADFYLGTEVVAQEDFDADRLLDFLPHPRVGDLVLEYGEPTVFQLYSTIQEPGSYNRVIVTYTIADTNGNQFIETFHFAVNEEDITPYSTSDRTDWSPVTRTEERWNFHFIPENTSDSTIAFVGSYETTFENGLPMSSDFFDKSKVSPAALQAIRTLRPGQLSYYQAGVPHRYNTSDERETVMVFKDESGQLYLQTFHFALEEEYCIPEVIYMLQLIGDKRNLDFLNTPADIQKELGTAQYTRQEIRQMIDDGLSLEELAEKISTVYDVQQFILEAGIVFFGADIKQSIDGTLWHFSDSPAVVLQKGTGTCGSGSNLINYLLRDDYDEQGYFCYAANRSGHIFNYFRSGEKYYIWDWNWREEDCFSVYGADSLEDFTDVYISMNQTTEAPAGRHRILCLYAYPYEGNVRPLGDSKITTVSGMPPMNTIATEIEELVNVLYVDNEKYAPVFKEAPPVSQWPADAQ